MFTSCAPTKGIDKNLVTMSFNLARQYTGKTENTFTILLDGDEDSRFNFTAESSLAIVDKPDGSLKSDVITFTYTDEGIYTADFKINRQNGSPFLHKVLTWEYSTEKPDPPIISFANRATNSLSNFLQVSDSRTSNTTGLWLKGDLTPPSTSTLEDGGFWQDLDLETLKVPVTLTTGDGVKTVTGKFQNIFGNYSEEGVSAEIILKQTAPTNCSVNLLTPTVANNKVSLKLFATDPYQMYYSVTGDVRVVIDSKEFADEEVVYVYVEPSEGQKTIYITMQDIAGNSCLDEKLNVTIDPDFVGERIDVENHKYWTDDENVIIDVFFDHFKDQEPLEVKITGDVVGANTNRWLSSLENISLSLAPTTTGERRIFAQYRDSYGEESYQIAKQIYLKPEIAIANLGGAAREITVSQIPGTEHVTITGCTQSYNQVPLTTTYSCTANAGSIDVTYAFADGSTLTKSGVP